MAGMLETEGRAVGEGVEAGVEARPGACASAGAEAPLAGQAILVIGDRRMPLDGRALRLILWVAARQTRINGMASEAGQLWMTWKGSGPRSIDGNIKAPL
ncbi:MAG TPA: hypothetical protein VIC85_05780 [Ktedonobacterales bacterium]|jgi:hypothetical protein